MRGLGPGSDDYRECILPPARSFVLPNVQWGEFDRMFTPAFWVGQAWLHEPYWKPNTVSLGSSLREEFAACVLGGHGIQGEVGVAAFRRIRDGGFLESNHPASMYERVLSQPLTVAGKVIRYRFPRQKAHYLAEGLPEMDRLSNSGLRGRYLRDALCCMKGVGPKTASWVVRNWELSDDVAILDIHVCRACILAGVFPENANPSRTYQILEDRFLEFSRAIAVRASMLDHLIWSTMRRLPKRFVSQNANH